VDVADPRMLGEQIISTYFLTMLPSLLIWIIAILIAAIRWKKHPGVSRLVIIAAVLSILLPVGNLCFRSWWFEASESIGQYFFWMTVVTGLSRVLMAGIWVLLLMAAFMWRTDSNSNR